MKEPYYHKHKVAQKYCYIDKVIEFELVPSLVESIIVFMLVLHMVLISVSSRKIGCRMSDVQVCVKLTATILTTFQHFLSRLLFSWSKRKMRYPFYTIYCSTAVFQNLQLCLNTAYLFYISYFVKYIYADNSKYQINKLFKIIFIES